jgi:8-oxo-dGTP pyrophosphatase MutT (NUDIX family)
MTTDDLPAPSRAAKHLAAGMLFTDLLGRILLVEPTYKPHWDVPGGIVEAGESLLGAVKREVEEELGMRVTVGRLLVVDDLGTAIMVIFDGGVIDRPLDIQLQAGELSSWEWSTPDMVTQRLAAAPILTRRVLAAAQAQQKGETYYLERGYRKA